MNLLILFRDAIIDFWSNGTFPVKIFGTLFFGLWFFAALWAASEILFFRHVLLMDGFLVFKRGLFISRKLPYDAIIRLDVKKEKIEYSNRTAWQNSLLYHGETLRIITENNEVVVRSIWLKDYIAFRNKLRQLAVNARPFSPGKFTEQINYTVLLLGGLFVWIMSYVNVFK
ncbi:hypothetical protein [Hymenobacter sp. BT730]|uniref:hypothetical protein n=1 Tax=Hymenobacter sp. BT730 TaxID=3063332 RepID=UPI0026DF0255|nr:hypothetical protein [Hymenobacter sp. BT730]